MIVQVTRITWTDDHSKLLVWQVIPQLSCPIALFTYYNPILKRGIERFMSTISDIGVHGKSRILGSPNCMEFISLSHHSIYPDSSPILMPNNVMKDIFKIRKAVPDTKYLCHLLHLSFKCD